MFLTFNAVKALLKKKYYESETYLDLLPDLAFSLTNSLPAAQGWEQEARNSELVLLRKHLYSQSTAYKTT